MDTDVECSPPNSGDYLQTLQDDYDQGLQGTFDAVTHMSGFACNEWHMVYEKVQKIGQGTFGEVFKVRHKTTKEYFALKRIRMEQEKEGFPITALREIRLLQALDHDNIIRLREICHTNRKSDTRFLYSIFYVYCDTPELANFDF